MKGGFTGYSVGTAAIAGLLFLILVSMPSAQSVTPDLKPTPRTSDSHPDLSGFYNDDAQFHQDPNEDKPGVHSVTRTSDGSVLLAFIGVDGETESNSSLNAKQDANRPPYKPEYMAKVNALAATMYGGNSNQDPQLDCKPLGVPRASVTGAGGTPLQIVQNKDTLALLYEAAPGSTYRVIYLDGRPHPKNLDASFEGHSVGHWEGDTLIVDVVGLNDETWLGDPIQISSEASKYATIHSDQLHVIERWTRKGDELTYEATLYDPIMFTKPWVITPRHARLADPDDYIQPSMCVPLDKGHFIKPTAKDQFKCHYVSNCDSQSLYEIPNDETKGGNKEK